MNLCDFHTPLYPIREFARIIKYAPIAMGLRLFWGHQCAKPDSNIYSHKRFREIEYHEYQAYRSATTEASVTSPREQEKEMVHRKLGDCGDRCIGTPNCL